MFRFLNGVVSGVDYMKFITVTSLRPERDYIIHRDYEDAMEFINETGGYGYEYTIIIERDKRKKCDLYAEAREWECNAVTESRCRQAAKNSPNW